MTHLGVTVVDVYVLRAVSSGGYEVLLLRRAQGVRCPGSWEAVHGHIAEGESPVQAALRELGEETGLRADRLYNLSRVDMFYGHRSDRVVLAPVFVAMVDTPQTPRVSGEHDAVCWMPASEAASRCAWPRERRALEDALALLGPGDAGPLEDVLRVC